MAEVWMGYAARQATGELAQALAALAPQAVLVMAESGQDLRDRVRQAGGSCAGAVVGLTEEGVSDINLAAALAHDASVARVVLVARRASGSLLSRARRAGVTEVVDLSAGQSPAPLGTSRQPGAEGRPGDVPGGVGEEGGLALLPGRAEAGETGALPGRLAWGGREGGRDQAEARPQRVIVAAAPSVPVHASAAADVRPASGGAPVMALASGRGGVGKTALAALVGATAASWGMRVALVDLDLSCGNLASCFGVGRTVDLARLAGQEGLTDEDLARACAPCGEGLSLWGPCERPETAELVSSLVGRLLDLLAHTHDLVVVDTSTTFNEPVARAVQRADRLLLVHDHAAGALAALGRTSGLAVRLGVARTRIVRVENFAEGDAQPDLSVGRVTVGLEGARAYAVPDGGEVAEGLLGEGRAAQIVEAGGALPEAVARLLAQTLTELGDLPETEAAHRALEAGHPKRRRSLFGRRKAS